MSFTNKGENVIDGITIHGTVLNLILKIIDTNICEWQK